MLVSSAGIVGGMLKPGDKAPAISLKDQSGKAVKLSGFKGRKVLVYFYPKADTPGCTTQACGLRDILGQIGDTAVVGISPDPPAKQAKFDTKYGLGFPLLADEDHSVAEAYGVWGEKSMYGRKYMGIERSAFLVDEKGKLAEVWYKVSPKDTPTNLLKALEAA
jgi:thioredoxin-dependent peroxiredoxin